VLLHDHLEGALRPATILELAIGTGYDGLPPSGEEELASRFDKSQSGSLDAKVRPWEETIAPAYAVVGADVAAVWRR
jgi:adenosine deaminase